ETVADALTLSLQSIDFYTHEAVDATHDSGFFDAQMSEIISDTFPILPKVGVTHAFKLLHADGVLLHSSLHNNGITVDRNRWLLSSPRLYVGHLSRSRHHTPRSAALCVAHRG